MNVAQARPRLWSPQVLLFALVLHVAVLYYVAVAFKVVPPPYDPTREPPTVSVYRPPPPPPPVIPEEQIVKQKPIFQQRNPVPPPIPVQVPPSPLPPVAVPTPGPGTILVGEPIPEQPVAQALPSYPMRAQANGIEGRVIMSITIMPDGSVRDVQVVSAQPRGYFEAAAVRAVQTWRYRPSNVVRTNVIVHMDFELRDG